MANKKEERKKEESMVNISPSISMSGGLKIHKKTGLLMV